MLDTPACESLYSGQLTSINAVDKKFLIDVLLYFRCPYVAGFNVRNDYPHSFNCLTAVFAILFLIS